jgi:hypothetical protein
LSKSSVPFLCRLENGIYVWIVWFLLWRTTQEEMLWFLFKYFSVLL